MVQSPDMLLQFFKAQELEALLKTFVRDLLQPGVRETSDQLVGTFVSSAGSRITAGDIIERIDGRPLTADVDFYALLNRKVGALTLLSMLDPRTNARWDESVKPIAAREESELLYRRWVRRRRAGGWTGSS